eukprot:gene27699-36514_t
MSEVSVGITTFANDHPGISGCIFKQRFSDFIVREIGLDGEIAVLKDTVCSELQKKHFPKALPSMNHDASMLSSADQSVVQSVLERVQSIVKIPLEKDKESELLLFIDKSIIRSEECSLYFMGIPCSDKLMRTSVHKLFKDDPQLSTYIDSDTQTVDGTTFVRLIAKHKRKELHIPMVQRRRTPWPQELGNFLQFTLLKENIDTMHAVTVLCNVLKLRPSSVGYNGTKDKRGVTAQFCTVYRKKPSDFGRVNGYKLPPFIRVGDFKYVHEPAKLGRLKGNRFELVLRSVTLEDSSVRLACEGLRSSGFINYYGLQRFGRGVTRSHEIGRSMMKSEWRQCIDMLFALNTSQEPGQEEERADLTRAKVLYKDGLWVEAMNALPASMSAEKQVLKRLQDNPADPLSAFNALPKNTRLLCAHAYQSYIWNLVASERIRRHGLRLLPGDLVAVTEAVVSDGEPLLLLEEELEDHDGEGADIMAAVADDNGDGDDADQETAGKGLSPRQGDDFQSANKKRQGRILQLSAGQVDSGVYSIRDVLLPLPGTGVTLPANDIGDLYKEILGRDGLKMEDYGSGVVAYRMSGAYRRLLQFPESFSWELLRYSDPNEELVATEVSQFREDNSKGSRKRARDNNSDADPSTEEDSSKKLSDVRDIPAGDTNLTSVNTQFQAQLTVQAKQKHSQRHAHGSPREVEEVVVGMEDVTKRAKIE